MEKREAEELPTGPPVNIGRVYFKTIYRGRSRSIHEVVTWHTVWPHVSLCCCSTPASKLTLVVIQLQENHLSACVIIWGLVRVHVSILVVAPYVPPYLAPCGVTEAVWLEKKTLHERRESSQRTLLSLQLLHVADHYSPASVSTTSVFAIMHLSLCVTSHMTGQWIT